MIKLCFTLLSTLLHSCQGKKLGFSDVSCPSVLPQEIQWIQSGFYPGPSGHKSYTLPLSHAGSMQQLFPKHQILDSSKLKEFADNYFKFDENGKKVLQTGRKYCGKRRNCSLRAISPFPTVFSKDLYVKTWACLGKG